MAKILMSLFSLFSLAHSSSTELVALQPAGGGGTGTILNWVSVSYPDNVTSASDVILANATGHPQLGAWDALDLGTSLMLTGHTFRNKFYGYISIMVLL